MTATSTSSETYERLRAAVLSGALAPGERLVETDLMASLDASRAAVRAAILRLHHEALVVHEPNRGAKVRRVSPREAIEILQARAALEALAAREAARRVSDEDLGALRALLAETEAYLQEGDLLTMSERNGELHALILRVAAHETVSRLVDSLSSQLVRYQYRTNLIPGRAAKSLREHRAIIDALADRDPDAAEAAMRAHLQHVTAALDGAGDERTVLP